MEINVDDDDDKERRKYRSKREGES